MGFFLIYWGFLNFLLVFVCGGDLGRGWLGWRMVDGGWCGAVWSNKGLGSGGERKEIGEQFVMTGIMNSLDIRLHMALFLLLVRDG
jgi:hypothetical protein